MRALILSILVVSVPLAGCIDLPTVETAAEQDVQAALSRVLDILQDEHDHLDPTLHEAAWNLDLVAHLPLNDGLGHTLSFGELDVVGDLAVVAVLQPIGGLVTIDVSDPSAPTVLGYHWAGASYAGDVKLSPDGRFAFLALNGGYAWDEVERDPKLAPTYATSAGVQVVDLSDPTEPKAVYFHPLLLGGVHMLDVHMLDGELHVFSVVYSRPRVPVPLPVDDMGVSSRIEISRLVTSAGATKLVHVSDYVPPEARDLPRGLHAPHDVTVVQDDELGPLMLVAYGRAGATVASLADVSNPQHLGAWTGHDGEYVHTIMMTIVDGKRVLVVTPEAFAAPRQNQAWFLDATDLSDMKLLGTWSLPGDLPFDGGYRFSTHNFYILDGKMYLAHFHAGVWVLDVSSWDKLSDPPVLAYHMPFAEGNLGSALGIPAAPLVWDVVPAKGHVMVTDIMTGFYVLEAAWEMPDELPYGTRGA